MFSQISKCLLQTGWYATCWNRVFKPEFEWQTGSGLTAAMNFSIVACFSLMPTYEYECQKCGYRFEVFQSINDKPKRTCPKCRGRVKRLIGMGAGLLFKGSGFYITDHRKPGYREAASKDSGIGANTSSSKNSTAAAPSTAGKKRSKE